MRRIEVGLALWAAALAIGFAVVFTLGRPLPSEAQQLEAALHPVPPVSRAAAEQAATTIVRLQFPDLAPYQPTVARRDDYGIGRWVMTYVAPGPVINGARISVAIESGQVEVAAFP
ncbi:MAG TPA: hypothetical protein VM451_09340 [Candidatus Limnocylindria bacterium]|nr:hypothetical protein [Candidatus Limnocylindria bacterium]